MDDEIIGLVGGGDSGKSHYIAALVKLLERDGALSGVGCISCSAVNQDIEERYDLVYYRPLFVHRSPLEKTQPLSITVGNRNPNLAPNAPLIYELVFERTSSLGRRTQKRVNLILFDAAGEELYDEGLMMQYHHYILNASALIMLIDPLTLPRVRDDQGVLDQIQGGEEVYEAFRLVNNVSDKLQRNLQLKPGAYLELPIAVTLSKSDLLRLLPWESEIPSLSGLEVALMDDVLGSDGFHLDQSDEIDKRVRALIGDLSPPSLTQALNKFVNASYHAVSATGCAVDDTGRFPRVTPEHCLDPLLSILWRLGIIDGVEVVDQQVANPTLAAQPS